MAEEHLSGFHAIPNKKSYFYHVNRAIKLPTENTTCFVNSRLFGWDIAPTDGMLAWLAALNTTYTQHKVKGACNPSIPGVGARA